VEEELEWKEGFRLVVQRSTLFRITRGSFESKEESFKRALGVEVGESRVV